MVRLRYEACSRKNISRADKDGNTALHKKLHISTAFFLFFLFLVMSVINAIENNFSFFFYRVMRYRSKLVLIVSYSGFFEVCV